MSLAPTDQATPTEKAIADLIFDIIKHGDEAHQGWLRLKSYKVAQAVRAEYARCLIVEMRKAMDRVR